MAVAHSVAGVVLTRAAQRDPARADHPVHIGAVLPSRRATMAYYGTPESANPPLNALYTSDPGDVGAFRLGVRSVDRDDVRELRSVFCADATDEDFAARREALTPDLPARFLLDPVEATAERWGSVPRTYVATGHDRATPPALQALMVEDVDAMTPGDPTQRVSIPGGHSPMSTRPQHLVDVVEAALRSRPLALSGARSRPREDPS